MTVRLALIIIGLIFGFILITTISKANEFDDLVNETIEDIVKDEVTIQDIIDRNDAYISSTQRANFTVTSGGTFGTYLTLFGYSPEINISGTHYIPQNMEYDEIRFNYGAYSDQTVEEYDYKRVIVDSAEMIQKEVILDGHNVTLRVTIKGNYHNFIKKCWYYDGSCYEYLERVDFSRTDTLSATSEKPERFSQGVNLTVSQWPDATEISVNRTDVGSIWIDSFGPSNIFNETNVTGNITVSLIANTFLLKSDDRGMYYGDAFLYVPPVIAYNNTLITYFKGVFYVPREVNVTNMSVRSPDGAEKVISIEKIQVTSKNPDNGWRIVIVILTMMVIFYYSFKNVVRW